MSRDQISLKVPLVDLSTQIQRIRKEVDAAISTVLDENEFVLGRQVTRLEEEIAAYCNCRFGAGVASGTDALLLSLKAAGVRPGDDVLTVPYTFFATAGAIHNAGARPVFVDVRADTYNMDASRLKQSLTANTTAILPVHLFGQCAEMECINDFAETHGLAVIEDAAQAIGALRKIGGTELLAGSMGLAGTLSFFPTKNLGGIGDAGMVVSNDPELIDQIKRYRVHGSRSSYIHQQVGFNSRLDTLQAAVLLVKLPYVQEWSRQRRLNAATYGRLLREPELEGFVFPPLEDPANTHIYHQYVIRCADRDGLQEHLRLNGVSTAVYYPVPLHLQECFKYLGYEPGDFPVSEELARTSLALPVSPELTLEQLDYVVGTIQSYYHAN